MTGPAVIVHRRGGIFQATHAHDNGKVITATGRWTRAHGAQRDHIRNYDEVDIAWPKSEVVEVRWLG